MKIIWTQEALERLSEIEEFIGRSNPDNAETFILHLIDKGESIADNSKKGRIVPEFQQEDIREVIVKKYRIIYRLTEETVEILTVFEGHKALEL